ncbi:ANTAR domain-containing protein [Streptomyces sp. NPDC002573]|uniref:ANTAR domain-containing protein n=1 Tax=Streptomyces sp. NPDC002573 TaxID=3364651 RepID=UPI00368346D2
MACFGCTADEAWEILLEVSQNSNVKLRTVADEVAAAVSGQGPMQPDLQGRVQTAVGACRSRRRETGAGG